MENKILAIIKSSNGKTLGARMLLDGRDLALSTEDIKNTILGR